jgi:hypothetical protein
MFCRADNGKDTQVSDGFSKFKSGVTFVEDAECSGCPLRRRKKKCGSSEGT